MRSSRAILIVLGGALVTAAPGCEGHFAAEAPPSARELLAEPLRLDVSPADSAVLLSARLDRGDHVDEARVALAVDRGWIDLAARGSQLELDGVEVRFAPIDLPTSVLPAGVRLVDVRVHLARPVVSRDAAWSTGDGACDAGVTAALDLDWSLEIAGGAPYPLATQELGDLPLDLSVSGGGDALDLALTGDVPGVTWSWADVVFLGDVDLTLASSW